MEDDWLKRQFEKAERDARANPRLADLVRQFAAARINTSTPAS